MNQTQRLNSLCFLEYTWFALIFDYILTFSGSKIFFIILMRPSNGCTEHNVHQNGVKSNRFKIPLTGCAVKCEIHMEFLSGNSTKQLKPHIHLAISVFMCVTLVCVTCSPLCEKHEHQSKYHSCSSHYKNQTSLTTFFPLHKICIHDCKTVLNYLNEIVHELPEGCEVNKQASSLGRGGCGRTVAEHVHTPTIPIHAHLHSLNSCPLTQAWQKCLCDSFRL